MVQKCLYVLWAENGLRQSVKLFCRQTNWNLEFFFGKHGCSILCTKEEQDHPTCYQLSVQKPALVPLQLAACTSGKAPSALKGMYRFIAPTQNTGFSVLLTSARQCKTTYCNYQNFMKSSSCPPQFPHIYRLVESRGETTQCETVISNFSVTCCCHQTQNEQIFFIKLGILSV